jgi:3-hydroxybutyryl-CoA dehydrogenase
MKTIGIIGAGTMGAGIAHVSALSGFTVLLHDVSDAALESARSRIAKDMQSGVDKQKLSPQEMAEGLGRLQFHASLNGLRQADLVIEAALERLELKRDLFQQLESVCSETALLASNTSSLSITSIASGMAHPERVLGMHFFNPVPRMKLVELIRGYSTDEGVLEAATKFVKLLGKVPVTAKDSPGFIVNRIARPFYGEALRLLGEGVASVEDIDRIVRLEGGFKMGPFELMDLIGIDVNFAVTKSMYEQTFGEPRYRPHIIQKTMVEAKLLGRKTKRGFYGYP